MPLGLTVAASVTDAAILKKIVESDMRKLKILNEEMNHIMKTVKCHKESCLLKQKNKKGDFFGPPRLLTNFEIQKYYQNKSKFNGVYSTKSLPKIKDGVYVINLDEFKSIETHWILYMSMVIM